MQRRQPRLWSRVMAAPVRGLCVGIISLTLVSSFVGFFLSFFGLAIVGGSAPLILVGLSAGMFLLAMLGLRELFPTGRPDDDPYSELFPQTDWRLRDPHLSTRGLWLAELRSHPPGTVGFRNDNGVEEYISSLIRAWSYRSGWPYRGCQVVRVKQARPGTNNPFLSDDEWWRVYRVTLRVRGGPGEGHLFEYGWIHLGDGFVEFRLAPAARPEGVDLEAIASLFEPERFPRPFPVTASRRDDPMWDRWLDG